MSLSPSYQRLQLGEEAKKAAGLIAWFLVVGIVSAHAQDPGTLKSGTAATASESRTRRQHQRGNCSPAKQRRCLGHRDRLAHMEAVVLPALSRCQSRDQLGR